MSTRNMSSQLATIIKYFFTDFTLILFGNCFRLLYMVLHSFLSKRIKRFVKIFKSPFRNEGSKFFRSFLQHGEVIEQTFFNDERVEHFSKLILYNQISIQRYLFINQHQQLIIVAIIKYLFLYMKWAEITSHKAILHFLSFIQLSSQFYILLMLSQDQHQLRNVDYELRQTFLHLQSWTADPVSKNRFIQMAQVLSKMAKFFNDMAEQCLTHLAGPQAIGHKQRINQNKQSLEQFQNSKTIDKLNLQPKNTYKTLKKDLVHKKIKSHKPKHPLSSFFIFYKDKGQTVAKMRGEVLGSKIAKVVGQLWKNMSQAEKQPYQAKARMARQKYEQQMNKYKIKYIDELQRLKQLKRQARILRKYQQDKKQSGKQVVIEKQRYNQSLEDFREEKIKNQRQPQESSSDDSDIDLQDDLSNSLSQIHHTFDKQLIAEDLSLSKQINKSSQQKQTIQIKSIQKQRQQSSEQIGDLLQSSSQDYNEIDVNLPIQIMNVSPTQQFHQIQLIDKNQLQTLQRQLKDTIPIQDQINEQIQAKNKDQQCQIADSDIKQEINEPSQEFIKPKGPVSSFFLFYKQKGKQISESRGLPLGPKVIKVASQIWKRLSEEDKKVYLDKARQTRKKYYENKQQLKKKYGYNIFQKTRTAKSTVSKNKHKK